MKVCTTCGQEWETTAATCPDDGGALSVVVGERALGKSSGPKPALQLQPEPEPDVDRDALPIGMQVGEYQIERQIGVGGMGVVYGARHPVIGKRAAIKVLNARLSGDREAVSRFMLEAQSVNQIGHANIVDIFSFGTLDDGRSYFAMEWLQGETLGDRVTRGRLNLRETTTILIALCRALEAAHAAGVIHRDLKPDNVFLATDDEGWRVKLLDFGIAKLSTANPSVSKTATGMVVGTPLFMAPEQAKGEAVDGRTDVYALGLLAYTMVCGTSLFEDESSAIEVLAAHLSKIPPSPRTLAPDLPRELDALILAMLAKRMDARPSLLDVRQRLTAIASLQTGPVARAATDPSVGAAQALTESLQVAADDEPIVPATRARWPIAVGMIAVLGIGGGAAYLAMSRGQPAGEVAANVPPARADAAPVVAPIASDAAVAAVAPIALDAAIELPPPPPPATAEFAIAPADATLTIDGVGMPVHDGRASLAIAPGPHTAIATAGTRTVRKAFSVAVGQVTTLALTVPAASGKRPPSTPPPGKPPVTAPKPKPPGVDVDAVQDPFAK